MKYFIAAALTGGAGAVMLCYPEMELLFLLGLLLVGIGIVFLTMTLICLAAKLAGKPRPSSALMFAVGDAVLMLAVFIYSGSVQGLIGGLLILFAVPALGIMFFAALSIWASLKSKTVRRDESDHEQTLAGSRDE